MPFQLDTVFVWVSDLDRADTGVARFAGFTDPDGNEIPLLERR